MKNMLIFASALVAVFVTYAADDSWQQGEMRLRSSWVRIKPFLKYPGSPSTEGDAFHIKVSFDPDSGDTWETLANKVQEKMGNECTMTALLFRFDEISQPRNFYTDTYLNESISIIDWMRDRLKKGDLLEFRARFDCDQPKVNL